MMMHLLIAPFHTHASDNSVRRWNSFAWLACVCLFGAGTCKSKSAVGSIESATLASKLSSTTVTPSSKRTTQDKKLVVTPRSSKKENTSAISTSQQASKATQSGGTATGSKQTNASGSTSEKPPIFSFKEQHIAIQAGEQKQLTLQASGNTDGYVVKSVSIKKASSTTPYQNQFGLKDCIEKNHPCFFPESGFSLNLHPVSTATAGIYTLTIRIGKQGVNSSLTNQLVTCEIVVGEKGKGKKEEFVAYKEAEIRTDNALNQDEIENETVSKVELVESKEVTDSKDALAQEQSKEDKEDKEDKEKNLFIAFSAIQQLNDNTLICKVGEKITIDYEFKNPGQYVISNVQMIKSGNKNSSPRSKDFKMDILKYKQGSVFENTIEFCAQKEGNYTLWLTLRTKGATKVEKFPCPISIISHSDSFN